MNSTRGLLKILGRVVDGSCALPIVLHPHTKKRLFKLEQGYLSIMIFPQALPIDRISATKQPRFHAAGRV